MRPRLRRKAQDGDLRIFHLHEILLKKTSSKLPFGRILLISARFRFTFPSPGIRITAEADLLELPKTWLEYAQTPRRRDPETRRCGSSATGSRWDVRHRNTDECPLATSRRTVHTSLAIDVKKPNSVAFKKLEELMVSARVDAPLQRPPGDEMTLERLGQRFSIGYARRDFLG